MTKKHSLSIFRSLLLYLSVLALIFSFSANVAADDNGTVVSFDSWTMFRGNSARTGKTTKIGPPDEIELRWRWRYYGDSAPVTASPVIGSDGRIYVGTEDGRLAAIKPSGGSGWVYQEKLDAFAASPAVDSSGNLLAVTEDGYIYYIDSDGELLWKCDLNRDVLSSPLLNGNTAYLGTNYGDVKGINLDPDESFINDNSKKIELWNTIQTWSYDVPTFDAVKSSSAFYGNTLFFGAGDYIYAVNPTDNNTDSALKWKFDLNGDVDSTPAVHGGVVYVTTEDGKLYALKENISGDDQQGDVIWQRNVGSGKLTSPAVADHDDGNIYVYVGSADGNLYAYDSDGRFKWSAPTYGSIESSPAVDGNGDIYFGSNDGNIYALYPDGSQKWSYQTLSKVRSSPAIGPDNLLYVGADNGYLYCIGEDTDDDREADIKVNVSLSNNSVLENDGGNYLSVTAKIVATDDSGVEPDLNKINAVTIDLSGLYLEDNASAKVDIKDMYDDGLHDDGQANDGTYTFEFKATKDAAAAAGGDIPTYYLNQTGLVPAVVGPVPIMVTATDIFGHRISTPAVINLKDKKVDCIPSDNASQTITNRIDGQTLTFEFTPSGAPQSIVMVQPSSASYEQVITLIIQGSNTNFRKDQSVVQVLNDSGFAVAYTTDSDDIILYGDEYLVVNLTILGPEAVTSGSLIGTWDVVVTTGTETVIGDDLFTITGASSRVTGESDIITLPVSETTVLSRTATSCTGCCYKVEVKNEAGSDLRDTFWTNSTTPGAFTIENVDAGVVNIYVTQENCSGGKYDISTEASNFGYLKGEVKNGFIESFLNEPFESLLNDTLGDALSLLIPGFDLYSVDDATVAAFIGDDILSDGASTLSSGGGYYILPLAAGDEPYTVGASWYFLNDIDTDLYISENEATEHNFSVKPDLSCLISALFGTDSLKTFYSFRDNVLVKSRAGQRWTDLYYTHSWEVFALAITDPDILAQCIQTLFYAVAGIPEYLITGKAGFMFALSLNDLFDMLEDSGSDALRSTIQIERDAILTFAGANYLN